MFTTSFLALIAALPIQLSTTSLAHPVLEQRASPIVLGDASSFGAVAATTITSTGATVVTGNIGTCPGTSITGFGPGAGTCTGSINSDNTLSCSASAACLSAYNSASSLAATTTLPTDLGGQTLSPGVYGFSTVNAVLSSTLVLNGTSDPDGQFIFQISTTFGSASGAKVSLVGGAKACNVFFLVGSSARVGSGGELMGNLLAYTSISVDEGASSGGTFCALNGAVTLIDDALTSQGICGS